MKKLNPGLTGIFYCQVFVTIPLRKLQSKKSNKGANFMLSKWN